jgi:hypothetical protein
MIAVTTHAKLKSVRHTVPMLFASRMIANELRVAPHCDRYANVVAGLTEFWTISLWQDGDGMRSFMARGSHGRIKWDWPRWLECYWGMR